MQEAQESAQSGEKGPNEAVEKALEGGETALRVDENGKQLCTDPISGKEVDAIELFAMKQHVFAEGECVQGVCFEC